MTSSAGNYRRVLAEFVTKHASQPRYLAVGVFDGVHRGHQQILQAMAAEAAQAGCAPCVVTFDPHPLTVVRPELAPPLLTTLAARRRLIAACGVDQQLVLPFTAELARCEAETFIKTILVDALNVRRIYVGYSFTFGRGGRGTPAMLQEWGGHYGFDVRIFQPIRDGDAETQREILSSTQIRWALQAGDVRDAWRGLGRPHVVTGKVIRGAQRGRALGFPTANLAPAGNGVLWPSSGVYAVVVSIDGRLWGGVANLGRRPTVVADGALVLEVHVFDYAGDLYDRTLQVGFLRRLRGEKRFASLADLQEQIKRDAAQAAAIWQAEAAGLHENFLFKAICCEL